MSKNVDCPPLPPKDGTGSGGSPRGTSTEPNHCNPDAGSAAKPASYSNGASGGGGGGVELVCLVCADLLYSPKTLNCLHSFCAECLENFRLKKQKGKRSSGLPQSSSSASSPGGPGGAISCPKCQSVTNLTSRGIKGLPSNSEAIALIENLTEKEKLEMEKPTPLIKKERKKPLAQNCPHHNKPLEYYCQQCSVLACGQCLLDEHRVHDSVDYAAKFTQESIESLKTVSSMAEDVASGGEAAIRGLAMDAVEAEKDGQTVTDAIHKYFTEVREVLSEREEELLRMGREEVKRVVSLIEKHQSLLRETVDKTKEVIATISEYDSSKVEVLARESELKETLALQMQSIQVLSHKAIDRVISVPFSEDSSFKRLCKTAGKGLSSLSKSQASPSPKSIQKIRSSNAPGSGSPYIPHVSSPRIKPPLPHHHHPSPATASTSQDKKSSVDKSKGEPSSSSSPPSRRKRSVSTSPQHAINSPPGCEVMVRANTRSPGSESTSDGGEPLSPGSRAFTMDPKFFSRPHGVGKSPSPPVAETYMVPLFQPIIVVTTEELTGSMFRGLSGMVKPCGVCSKRGNNSIVVTDTHHHCLRVLSSGGKFFHLISSEGKVDGKLTMPTALAADSEGNILVVEKDGGRVQKFSELGTLVSKFGSKLFRGTQLGETWGITISYDGRILISDCKKQCVHVFEKSGKYRSNFGSNMMKEPIGLALDKRGRVLVADKGCHCVWVFTPDGTHLESFGRKGQSLGELYYPFGLAVDKSGNVYVSEGGNHRISVFNARGEFKTCIGQKGKEPGMFQYPRHVCVDENDRLIVADELNQRLQIFDIAALLAH